MMTSTACTIFSSLVLLIIYLSRRVVLSCSFFCYLTLHLYPSQEYTVQFIYCIVIIFPMSHESWSSWMNEWIMLFMCHVHVHVPHHKSKTCLVKDRKPKVKQKGGCYDWIHLFDRLQHHAPSFCILFSCASIWISRKWKLISTDLFEFVKDETSPLSLPPFFLFPQSSLFYCTRISHGEKVQKGTHPKNEKLFAEINDECRFPQSQFTPFKESDAYFHFFCVWDRPND